jgi:glycosyltransferase involved in cell wall biosynthesis
VVICSYNSAHTLGAALSSAFAQEPPSQDYEVILVDDGSTDFTPSLAEEYAENYANFRYLRHEVNQGLVPACNLGLEAAEGRYFIRLDADDTFHCDILSCCTGPLELDETDLVYSDRYDVTPATGQCELVRIETFNLFNMLAAGSMFRTDMLRELGGYRDLFWEEYDLYLRYVQHSPKPPVRIPRPLYSYTRHPSSMTADTARVHDGWEELEGLWGEQYLRKFGWAGPHNGESQ